jgi:hypothetical protein
MFVIKAKATDAMWKRTWTRDSANKDCWTLTLLLLHFQSITKSHTAVLIHKSSSELRSDHTSTGQTIFGHVPRDWTRESFAHAPQSCQQTASIILNRPLLPHHIANFFFHQTSNIIASERSRHLNQTAHQPWRNNSKSSSGFPSRPSSSSPFYIARLRRRSPNLNQASSRIIKSSKSQPFQSQSPKSDLLHVQSRDRDSSSCRARSVVKTSSTQSTAMTRAPVGSPSRTASPSHHFSSPAKPSVTKLSGHSTE